MISAVILDLGNVLVFHDNEKLFTELARLFHTTREAMRERLDGGLWERVNRGQLPGDALRAELVHRLGHDVSPEDFFATWNCHFTVHDAVLPVVERLVGRVKLVLLSNTHDQHVQYLRPKLPVLERFDGLVLSCEVGLLKPEPDIYRRALALANVPATEAVFFDDVERFVRGAEAQGLHGRVFTTARQFAADLHALHVPGATDLP